MSKTKKQVMTDPILRKAHRHDSKRDKVPRICPTCFGTLKWIDTHGNEVECPDCADGIAERGWR